MRVRWLPGARVDLDRIDDFWREIEPKLAARAAAVIFKLAESLDVLPDRGRTSRFDPATRELVGKFGSGAFILRYQVVGEDVLVVQVRHSKELP